MLNIIRTFLCKINISTNINKINHQLKSSTNLNFTPCPRDICYCNIIITEPKKTIITQTLILNALKCKREYYTLQEIVNRENKI